MTPSHDWKALVRQQARATGAADLPQHTVDELAAHLEDLYIEAVDKGQRREEAFQIARAALAESALGTVPRPRTRGPELRPANELPTGGGLTGLAGGVQFAW